MTQMGRMAAIAALMTGALWLSGCESISQKFADSASQMPGIGLPANAPERPAVAPAYPAVHDIPPPRNSVALTNMEQQKLEDDLLAARDQQQGAVGLPPQPNRKSKPSPPRPPLNPVTSSRSIY